MPLPSDHPRESIDPIVVNAVLIAVRQAANVLCDRWTLLTLLFAHCGVTRFADFRDRCGVATRLLSSRLTMLEEQEVMVRIAYTRRPLRHGYHLTHMGLELFDVFSAMLRWEQRWHPAASGPGLVIEHLGCGAKAVAPDERCAACDSGITPRQVHLKIRQKGIHGMPERATSYRRSSVSVATRDPALALPLPHALDIFGDKWSIEVIMCAFVRVTSFGDFQLHTGMSTNILTDRLGRLTAAGVLTAVAGRGAYRLTEQGQDLFAVLVRIEAWADTWLRDRTRSPLKLMHTVCEKPLRLLSRCSACGEPLQREVCRLSMG